VEPTVTSSNMRHDKPARAEPRRNPYQVAQSAAHPQVLTISPPVPAEDATDDWFNPSIAHQ
jgi:hypothetical protein